MKRQGGLTLIEIIISSSLGLLVLGVVLSVLFSGRGHFEAASSSYLVSQDAEAALRWIKRDLQETALSSLRVYPNESSPQASPGFTLVSPRNARNELQFNIHGAPKWSSYITYSLGSDGVLKRHIEEFDFRGQPVASSKPPHEVTEQSSSRVVLRQVAQAGEEMGTAGKLSSRGGFDLQFVRRNPSGPEILTSWNPSDVTSGLSLSGRNSKLVQLLLTVKMNNFRASKSSFVQLPIRVMIPR